MRSCAAASPRDAVGEGRVAGVEGGDLREQELGCLLAKDPTRGARVFTRARPLPEGDPCAVAEGAAEEGGGLGEVGGELLAEALDEEALMLLLPARLLQRVGLKLLLALQP